MGFKYFIGFLDGSLGVTMCTLINKRYLNINYCNSIINVIYFPYRAWENFTNYKKGLYMTFMKKINLTLLSTAFCFAGTAYANEVRLTTHNPTDVTYRLAYQEPGKQPVLGELRSIRLDKTINIPVDLNHHMVAGIVIASVGGRELPEKANQFNHANRCSLATDDKVTGGELEFTLEPHRITCFTHGGVVRQQ